MAEIRWTLESVNDIEDIAEFVGKFTEKYASYLVQEFFISIEQLDNFPKSGRMVPEFNDEKIRELIVHDYRVVYLVKNADQIDVIAVHPAKKPMKNLK